MDNDGRFIFWFCFWCMLVAVFISGFSYKQGKMAERKALTEGLVSGLQAAYWEGYTDALTGMRKASK